MAEPPGQKKIMSGGSGDILSAGNLLNIKIDPEKILSGEIMICNHTGQVVIRKSVDRSGLRQINLSSLSSGLYFIKIKSEVQASHPVRFIKR